jgi:hypothetical protein
MLRPIRPRFRRMGHSCLRADGGWLRLRTVCFCYDVLRQTVGIGLKNALICQSHQSGCVMIIVTQSKPEGRVNASDDNGYTWN